MKDGARYFREIFKYSFFRENVYNVCTGSPQAHVRDSKSCLELDLVFNLKLGSLSILLSKCMICKRVLLWLKIRTPIKEHEMFYEPSAILIIALNLIVQSLQLYFY